MVKVTLPVTKLNSSETQVRDITLDASSMSIEDWFESDRRSVVPNKCKVFANGQVYQANISRRDLEKLLSEAGVKIITTKAA